jgi:hypothetical protein
VVSITTSAENIKGHTTWLLIRLLPNQLRSPRGLEGITDLRSWRVVPASLLLSVLLLLLLLGVSALLTVSLLGVLLLAILLLLLTVLLSSSPSG